MTTYLGCRLDLGPWQLRDRAKGSGWMPTVPGCKGPGTLCLATRVSLGPPGQASFTLLESGQPPEAGSWLGCNSILATHKGRLDRGVGGCLSCGKPEKPGSREVTLHPVSCSTTHWKQVLFMMDEPVSVLMGDVVTGSVVLQRNPVWRRHMSVALSWSVTSTQDPTSQKVRYLAVKSGARVLVLGDGSVVITVARPHGLVCLCHFSNLPEGKWMLLLAEQETEVQEGESVGAEARPRLGPPLPVSRRPRWRNRAGDRPSAGAFRWWVM